MDTVLARLSHTLVSLCILLTIPARPICRLTLYLLPHAQAPLFSTFSGTCRMASKRSHSSRCGYHDKRPHCNFCLRYGHTEAECHTKARQQHKRINIPQVNPPKQSDDVSISIDAYNEFLQYKAAMQPTQLSPLLLSLVIM